MPETNPLLLINQLPSFDRITPDLAERTLPRILETAATQLARLEADATPCWEGCMEPLFTLMEPLDYAWGIVSHLHSVMNTPEWRRVHETLQPQIVAFSTRTGQSEPLYRAMRAIRDGESWDKLDEARQRLITSALFSARTSGVGLPAAARERMGTLHDQLAAASTTFSNHLLDATKAFALELNSADDIANLPVSLVAAAAATARRAGKTESTTENGPWHITLEAPLFMPFMQYSTRRDHRETLYRAFVTRAADGEFDNTALIDRILAGRREMAALLDAGSYANLILQSRMADDIAAVDRLTARLREAARPAAEREHAALADFARLHGQGEPLMPWDIAFWSEQMRKARFDFDDETLRPYLQFPRVLEALFELAYRLFGVSIQPADGQTPVWHPDVRFFEIRDADGSPRASFFLDPYSRPETKRGGAWMDAVRPRKRLADGSRINPAAYLVCNQSLPDGDRPALMTLNEVTTLFHEFGHALQHLLTTVDIPAASGIHNVEWDAVELASQFMENWCYHAPVLGRMSRHIETGAPLPDALIARIIEARTFRAGSTTLRQLLFGAVDMELHARYGDTDNRTPNAIKEALAPAYSVLPVLPVDRFLCGFAHIFAGGYAAGYYSYKWAEVLSADAFAAFEDAGLDNPGALEKVGRRFRDTVLADGGARHPMAVFRDFRGRNPDPEALLRQMRLLA